MTQRVIEMPNLGVGTFRLEGDTAYNSVKMALDVGFRHIDTAQIYGNEEQVGQAIKDSNIPRSEIFLTTKVWNNKLNKTDFIASVEKSLEKLQVDSVDLLLIHWPAPSNDEPMSEYLTELLKAKQLGLTKHIGVSNFTIANLNEAMQTLDSREIFTNQVEVHPYLTNTKLRAFCAQHGIHVTAYMPFVVGKVLKDETILDIANKHNASPAQIVIAWENANDMTTIPSSTKRKNLEDNFNDHVKLDDEDIARIDALDCGDRQATPDFAPQWDQ
ncbi:2,5-didehydrogluconate reductase B [Pseudoalteromonas sp. 13-15]|jgi:2,5-diketo-D-gluconate reductase B|uniref:2,5-didehydrogluconate reductase DkgB n=1 Tax=Pseudoalteromonas TaxID=53246 RepID=UPI000231991E|nr:MULTISPECIES: 2,5-didehydrogluconate reductase DkgB [Pseudoalteromonas]AUL75081.1 2,5-didehydrogluconate reductase B [Pseudoalteromonas sp. 13-15]TMS83470.1 2,5-didehydrogluconate reductase DkgB [Pseudoalteromonas sp. S554]UOB75378.1 2,5-didehydrogluconate reductase DkgB [Pseudoalteromonas sp. APM04]WFO21077.1 2,5-didehydrogluconate reductase DkgB [Pseudoalteromonas sp. H100]SIO19815.1 2,5-diketo-D-gluconate reductase B [Pseudoalteromonas marina]|tara:strand:- start:178 stop:993 length:816 start_codon:yes stop_codon:yes gene_type:complete